VIFEQQLVARAVEGVELGVAAPVDRDVELLTRLVLTRGAVQQIGEEAGGKVAVLGSAQRVVDGAHHRCPFERQLREDPLALLDVRPGECEPVERQP
jgi:hypothetical protein